VRLRVWLYAAFDHLLQFFARVHDPYIGSKIPR
jgi:hypothetical protein